MKTIFLHIGMPKTGTSIIQSHLCQNRDVLRDKGFLYPITVSADKSIYRTFESHHLLMYSISEWSNFNRFCPNLFLEMAEETAAEHKIDTMILSAENIYWLPTELYATQSAGKLEYWDKKNQIIARLRKLFKYYDVKIIVYVRRQDKWIESWYNQQIKNGSAVHSNISEFIDHFQYLLDYETNLRLWAEHFGKDNIHVKIYEKQQLSNGLFQDFLLVIGGGAEAEFPLKQPARYNAQLSRDALEFMRICSNMPMNEEQRRWFRLTVRKITKQFESREIFKDQAILNPIERRALLDKYASMNERLARDWLGRDDGLLFYDPEPQANDDWSPYPGLSTQSAVRLIAGLLLEMRGEAQSTVGEGASPSSRSDSSADRQFWRENIWASGIN